MFKWNLFFFSFSSLVPCLDSQMNAFFKTCEPQVPYLQSFPTRRSNLTCPFFAQKSLAKFSWNIFNLAFSQEGPLRLHTLAFGWGALQPLLLPCLLGSSFQTHPDTWVHVYKSTAGSSLLSIQVVPELPYAGFLQLINSNSSEESQSFPDTPNSFFSISFQSVFLRWSSLVYHCCETGSHRGEF